VLRAGQIALLGGRRGVKPIAGAVAQWVGTFNLLDRRRRGRSAAAARLASSPCGPGRRNRTVVQGTVAVPVAECASASSAARAPATCSTARSCSRQAFDSFRYKFDLAAAQVTSEHPRGLRALPAPGRDLQADRQGRRPERQRFFRAEQALTVPAVEIEAPPTAADLESARLLAAANALSTLDNTIRIIAGRRRRDAVGPSPATP
jgi:hypothetical protein